MHLAHSTNTTYRKDTSTKFILSFFFRCMVCGSGKSIKVFSILSGECVHELRGHSDDVTSIVINPENPFQVQTFLYF